MSIFPYFKIMCFSQIGRPTHSNIIEYFAPELVLLFPQQTFNTKLHKNPNQIHSWNMGFMAPAPQVECNGPSNSATTCFCSCKKSRWIGSSSSEQMWGINNTQTMVDEGCLMLGLNYWCNMNAFNSFRRTVSNGIPLARLDHQRIIEYQSIYIYIYVIYVMYIYMLCIYICYVYICYVYNYIYIYLFNSIYSMLMSAMFFPPSWLPSRTNTPSLKNPVLWFQAAAFLLFRCVLFPRLLTAWGRTMVPCRHLHGGDFPPHFSIDKTTKKRWIAGFICQFVRYPLVN